MILNLYIQSIHLYVQNYLPKYIEDITICIEFMSETMPVFGNALNLEERKFGNALKANEFNYDCFEKKYEISISPIIFSCDANTET